MARRIAPNLRNTLADPAEYELRLFFRGHESLAKGAPPPADDPNDKRPKLTSDASRHGPVQYDDHFRCVWWLDEFDHKKKAQEEQQTHAAAKVKAAQAKETHKDKKDKLPPLKKAWEDAKKAREDQDTKVEPLKKKWDDAVAEHDAANDNWEREKATLRRFEQEVSDTKSAASDAAVAANNAKKRATDDRAAAKKLEGELPGLESKASQDRSAAERAAAERQAAQAQADSYYKQITAGGRTPTPNEHGRFVVLEQDAVEKKRAAAAAEDKARASAEAVNKKKSDIDSAKQRAAESEQAQADREREKEQRDTEHSDAKAKIDPQKQKVSDEQKKIAPAKSKMDDAEKAHSDAVKERDRLKADEDEKKKKYDDAVAEEQEAKGELDTANNEVRDTDPAHIAREREKQHVKDAQDSGAAAANAVSTAETAEEAEKEAKEAQKVADTKKQEAEAAEQAATKAEQDANSLPGGATGTPEADAKKKATDDAKLLRDEATRKRGLADTAQATADQKKLLADAAKQSADNAQQEAEIAKKRAADEPEPLPANTEILKKEQNKKYRLLVTDNHAAIDFGPSDNKSKPDHYRDNDWNRDVFPVVPFEVVIYKVSDKKKIGVGASDVRVVWEVLDPPEELEKVELFRGPSVPKAWIKRFFDHFQAKTNDPPSQNDNCSTLFGGLRTNNGAINSTLALRKAPFVTSVRTLLDAAPAGGNLAMSVVQPGTDGDRELCGLSRVYFRVPPIGGDNYQLRLRLIDSEDKPVKFRDHEGKLVEFLDTGIFTVWRRTVIDFMVTFSSVAQDTINWEMTKNSYLPAFTQLVGPLVTKTYNRADWERICRKYFKGVGFSDAELNAAGVYDNAVFNKHLIPKYDRLLPIVKAGVATTLTEISVLPSYPGTAPPKYDITTGAVTTTEGKAKRQLRWTHTEGLSKAFLDDAYKKLNRVNPRAGAVNTNQKGLLPGLSVFFAKRPMEWSTVLGQYLNHREFQFVQVGDVTCTFAHELGHAVFLYHAWTQFESVGAINYTYTSEGKSMVTDHDQKDAIVCTMSYQNDFFGDDGKTKMAPADNPVSWHFCAACILKLRFYDMHKLRANAKYMQWALEGLGPDAGHPIRLIKNDGTDISTAAPLTAIAKNGNLDFGPLSHTEVTVNNTGSSYAKLITRALDYISTNCDRMDLVSWDWNTHWWRLKGNNVAAVGGDAREANLTTTVPAGIHAKNAKFKVNG
ncbi:MAG: hypothetical protein JNK25_15260 [Phycisphaerae bacterium]|nr:hypothetical protein [Phycisphaerae bacterium]